LSDASAEIATTPVTVVPPAGDVMAAMGGVVSGGGGGPIEPLASSAMKAAPSLENFSACVAMPALCAIVSLVVWMVVLCWFISASNGMEAAKPRLCHDAWSEHP
jgi:hypothetical protein